MQHEDCQFQMVQDLVRWEADSRAYVKFCEGMAAGMEVSAGMAIKTRLEESLRSAALRERARAKETAERHNSRFAPESFDNLKAAWEKARKSADAH